MMAGAFQASAFQISAFQTDAAGATDIISTAVLHNPVNCVLGGKRPKKSYRENDVRPTALKQRATVKKSGVQNLGGSKASFLVRTNNRGYD